MVLVGVALPAVVAVVAGGLVVWKVAVPLGGKTPWGMEAAELAAVAVVEHEVLVRVVMGTVTVQGQSVMVRVVA